MLGSEHQWVGTDVCFLPRSFLAVPVHEVCLPGKILGLQGQGLALCSRRERLKNVPLNCQYYHPPELEKEATKRV